MEELKETSLPQVQGTCHDNATLQTGSPATSHPSRRRPPTALPGLLRLPLLLLAFLGVAAAATARGVWFLTVSVADLAFRAVLLAIPVVVWAATKYVDWVLLSWLRKVEWAGRQANWLLWLLLPAAVPAEAAQDDSGVAAAGAGEASMGRPQGGHGGRLLLWACLVLGLLAAAYFNLAGAMGWLAGFERATKWGGRVLRLLPAAKAAGKA